MRSAVPMSWMRLVVEWSEMSRRGGIRKGWAHYKGKRGKGRRIVVMGGGNKGREKEKGNER